MLAIYGDNSPKAACIAIKLLSKVAQDVAMNWARQIASASDPSASPAPPYSWSSKAETLIVQCASGATLLWSARNGVTVAQSVLPPVRYICLVLCPV
jgi:hypothetical protein